MLRRGSPEQATGRRLAELYADHGRASYAFAYHLTGSREDAEDLVQTAFLAAHRALVGGEELVNARAWLLTTVKRRAFNLHRDRHELAASDQLEGIAGPSATGADAEAQVGIVRAALWALPEQQHQAFVLRHWSGLSYAEIATVLNTTPSAVESLLVRARAGVIAERDLDESCLAVRERLCSDQVLAPLHKRHLNGCPRCATARTRLARAAGVAAAVVLVPRIHVAQALASTIPGFTTKAALAGAAGSGAGGSGAAATGASKALLVKSLVGVVAVTGAVGAAHAHGLQLPGSQQPAHVAHSAAALQPAPAAPPIVDSLDNVASRGTSGSGPKMAQGGGDSRSSPVDGSSAGSGGTTTIPGPSGASSGSTDGLDAQSSGDSTGSGDTGSGSDVSGSDSIPTNQSADSSGSDTSAGAGAVAGD